MAQIPRSSPGSTQLRTESVIPKQSSTAEQNYVDSLGMGLQTIGGAVEKVASEQYNQLYAARKFTDTTRAKLYATQAIADAMVKHETRFSIGADGKSIIKSGIGDEGNFQSFDGDVKTIRSNTSAMFHSKTDEAEFMASLDQDAIVAKNKLQGEYIKKQLEQGRAIVMETSDNLVNQLAATTDPKVQEELKEKIKNTWKDAKNVDIYGADDAYTKGRDALETGMYRNFESHLASNFEQTKNDFEGGKYKDLTEKQKLLAQTAIDSMERSIERQKKFKEDQLIYNTDQDFSAKWNNGSLTLSDIANASLPVEEGGVGMTPPKQKQWTALVTDKTGPFQYRPGTNPNTYIKLNEMMESPEVKPTYKLDALIDALSNNKISPDVFNEFMGTIPKLYSESVKNNNITEQSPAQIAKRNAFQVILNSFGLGKSAKVSVMRDLEKFASKPNTTAKEIVDYARDAQLTALRSIIPNLDDKPDGAVVFNPADNSLMRVFKNGDVQYIDNSFKKKSKDESK